MKAYQVNRGVFYTVPSTPTTALALNCCSKHHHWVTLDVDPFDIEKLRCSQPKLASFLTCVLHFVYEIHREPDDGHIASRKNEKERRTVVKVVSPGLRNRLFTVFCMTDYEGCGIDLWNRLALPMGGDILLSRKASDN
jgi:hypothetical protein